MVVQKLITATTNHFIPHDLIKMAPNIVVAHGSVNNKSAKYAKWKMKRTR